MCQPLSEASEWSAAGSTAAQPAVDGHRHRRAAPIATSCHSTSPFPAAAFTTGVPSQATCHPSDAVAHTSTACAASSRCHSRPHRCHWPHLTGHASEAAHRSYLDHTIDHPISWPSCPCPPPKPLTPLGVSGPSASARLPPPLRHTTGRDPAVAPLRACLSCLLAQLPLPLVSTAMRAADTSRAIKSSIAHHAQYAT